MRGVGDGVSKLIRRSLGQTHLDKFDEAFAIFMDHYGRHCMDNTVLYPGVGKVLPELARDYSLAVLTNKSVAFSHKIITGLGIDSCFREVLGGDSLETKKPEPDGILYLADKWSLDPATEMVMVGDHVTDIEVGRRAGCRTVFITGGIGVTRDMPPDFVINSMLELPELLKRWQNTKRRT